MQHGGIEGDGQVHEPAGCVVAFGTWVSAVGAGGGWGNWGGVDEGACVGGNSVCDGKAQFVGAADDISGGAGGGVGVRLHAGSGFGFDV